MRRFYIQLDLTFTESYRAFLLGEAGPEALLAQSDSLQRLLPETGFAVGEWSLADVALVPVLLRFEVMMANEIGKYAVGEGKRTLEILKSPSKYAFLAINSKRVDLLIVDADARPRHAIEYQGSGHFKGADTAAARDAVKKEALRRAGIGYVEVVGGEMKADELRRVVEKLVAPAARVG